MLSSPFQQPSRRQNALARQIQEAKAAGDEALRSRLISQWVHRYGFNGAAELDLSLPEPTISQPEFSPAADAEEASFTPEPVVEQEVVAGAEVVAEAELILVEDEVDNQHEVVAEDEMVLEEEEQIAAKDDELVENELVAKDGTIVEKEEIAAEETLLQRSFPAAPVPAPPISTPRSLRRWLPRREDDAFPKAS